MATAAGEHPQIIITPSSQQNDQQAEDLLELENQQSSLDDNEDNAVTAFPAMSVEVEDLSSPSNPLWEDSLKVSHKFCRKMYCIICTRKELFANHCLDSLEGNPVG